MKLHEFQAALAAAPDTEMQWILPGGKQVPPHAHVTEVARIDKRFIDCGGKFREESLWRLQTWVAEDIDHRLTAGKLAAIIIKATSTIGLGDFDIDVEHEEGLISQYPIVSIEIRGRKLAVQLTSRHTDCLARELCCPPQPVKKNLLNQTLPNFS